MIKAKTATVTEEKNDDDDDKEEKNNIKEKNSSNNQLEAVEGNYEFVTHSAGA